MPTRTINLKLVLGKSESTLALRRALWTTHAELNVAVQQIERMLLLCRQDQYWTTDGGDEPAHVAADKCTAEALSMGRAAQKQNGSEGKGTDREVLKALRVLYEKLVPSCLVDENGSPLTGDAQASGAWVSPMMDPESEGGLSVYAKVLDPPPKWVHLKEQEEPGWKEASAAWLQSVEALPLLSATGSPPAWVRRLRNGQDWQDAFIEDQEKKRREIERGNAPVIRELKRLGLLPLVLPHFRMKLNSGGKGVSVWDRLAMRLAIAHLLSWESWNHNTKAEHNAAAAAYNALIEEHVHLKSVFDVLREYERARHERLKEVALASDDRPFRIGSRSIRAWDQIRQDWLQKGKDAASRMEILAQLQSRLRGGFGDPDFFRWLAAEGREHLWREDDAVVPFVKINMAHLLLSRRQEFSLMTFADSRLHPRWIMYEAPGGSNLRNYALETAGEKLLLRIKLLNRNDNGGLTEEEHLCRLAPSGQLSDLTLSRDGKKMLLQYRSAHQDFEGEAGGAEILFDRPYIEEPRRKEEQLESGRIGPVWFKLTLDVHTKAPEEWLDGRGRIQTPPEVHHFNTALSNKSKYRDKIRAGLRVLSVDLGLRSFAACSVFELVEGRPEKGLAFPAADGREENDPRKLWALHERSFTLRLPGEATTTREESARREAAGQVRALRRDMRLLRRMLQLGAEDNDQERDAQLGALLEAMPAGDGVADDDVPGFRREDYEGLRDTSFRSTPELWMQRCQQFHAMAEKQLSQRFGEWRRATRGKSSSWQERREKRAYNGGKSVWAIEYLDSVRRLIMSWSLHGRKFGEINRLNRAEHGTVAAGLLRHINKLKEDRTKTGADLLVQAARGYLTNPDGPGWQQRFAPCRLILFEDLARYRFRVDRPRRENSQLMKWNHREISAETTMQAELYGIITETTAAGFSSRFHASSGAPGVRCRVLTAEDFADELPRPYLAAELGWMLGPSFHGNAEKAREALRWVIRPGMMVPWRGGELFASFGADEKLRVIHADINAAQNLQRRFWTRCGEASRITCLAVGEDGGYHLDHTPGARLLGALQQLENGKGEFHLTPADDGVSYVMTRAGRKKGTKAAEGKARAEDGELDELLADMPEEAGTRRETFFRDPSGILFESNRWIPSKVFWSSTRDRIWQEMQKVSLERQSSDELRL